MGLQPRRHPARDRRAAAARMPLGRLYAAQFLLRLEKKSSSAPKSRGTKISTSPLVRRLTYCGAASQAHLQTLYGGDIRAMVRALADTGRMSCADTERLLRWPTEDQAANPEYDYE